MAYQSEAALEQQFIEQLNKQEYSTVDIPDYDALVENFKVQFEAFNAPKLDTPITDKEWERIFNLMLGKSVFQSAKILRDKFVLEREDGTKVYLSFFDQQKRNSSFFQKGFIRLQHFHDHNLARKGNLQAIPFFNLTIGAGFFTVQTHCPHFSQFLCHNAPLDDSRNFQILI